MIISCIVTITTILIGLNVFTDIVIPWWLVFMPIWLPPLLIFIACLDALPLVLRRDKERDRNPLDYPR